ncbi:hypothetical protein PROFUN_11325 [Planoprotostelium fungivorum]|uniref:Uncharacterized protein n=1 Tax=Planoprotostelium fungivorum TaxID=1890364 RepID=A0A2P6NAA0_9EUKA|nr:hypothetical protein PROFUN_11325 [Planoprotostelium fungivorum]
MDEASNKVGEYLGSPRTFYTQCLVLVLVFTAIINYFKLVSNNNRIVGSQYLEYQEFFLESPDVSFLNFSTSGFSNDINASKRALSLITEEAIVMFGSCHETQSDQVPYNSNFSVEVVNAKYSCEMSQEERRSRNPCLSGPVSCISDTVYPRVTDCRSHQSGHATLSAMRSGLEEGYAGVTNPGHFRNCWL